MPLKGLIFYTLAGRLLEILFLFELYSLKNFLCTDVHCKIFVTSSNSKNTVSLRSRYENLIYQVIQNLEKGKHILEDNYFYKAKTILVEMSRDLKISFERKPNAMDKKNWVYYCRVEREIDENDSLGIKSKPSN